MNIDSVIVVTGAAGFIGSCLVGYLNQQGFENLILVDDFSRKDKALNLKGKKYTHKVHREQFFEWLSVHPNYIQYVFHLGAKTDTISDDYPLFKTLNLKYSKQLWEHCTENDIPMVYASSAATYGNGEFGYNDSTDPNILHPLNAYAISKNEFDIWVKEQKKTPPFWAGLKFFNVYGPNEYHKGRMASVVYHAYNQIKERGYIKLFKSHRDDYKDGEQLRDFIYVKDIVAVCFWLMQQQPQSHLYNLGTGAARTFNHLAAAIFQNLHIPGKIDYIDTPEDIRAQYQYYTQANMERLHAAGYITPFYSLEDGVADYLKYYLEQEAHY